MHLRHPVGETQSYGKSRQPPKNCSRHRRAAIHRNPVGLQRRRNRLLAICAFRPKVSVRARMREQKEAASILVMGLKPKLASAEASVNAKTLGKQQEAC